MPTIRVQIREVREEFRTVDVEVSKYMLKKPKKKLKEHLLKKIGDWDFEYRDNLGDTDETDIVAIMGEVTEDEDELEMI
jgi:hypothetical protein